jgi:hypothetical protein
MSEDGNLYNTTSFRSQVLNSNRSHKSNPDHGANRGERAPAPIAGIRAKASPVCGVRAAPSQDRSSEK